MDNRNNEPICIDTQKIYDSCREKECLTDIRVYLTRCNQDVIDRAVSVKPDSAELLYAYIDVEPIQFNRGFYTVDVQYFYRVTVDAFCGIGRPQKISGLAFFQKRTILYGSEGYARIFSSNMVESDYDVQSIEKSNMPRAVVEVVDPIVLNARISDRCDDCFSCCEIPRCVAGCFDDEVDLFSDCGKKLIVTLGQFSIIRLERPIQIVIPQCDICMPEKECAGGSGTISDPCDLFQTFNFPVEQFFPPSRGIGFVAGENEGCNPRQNGCNNQQNCRR
ncbi:MAG: hypothetical protein R3Y09_05870 [Clostridia bacterium]